MEGPQAPAVGLEPRPDGSRLRCVDGAEYRHDKITGTIGDCARGIHKTSLVAADSANPFLQL
jgi:hypothetical protein